MVKKSFATFAFMLSVLLYAATPSSGQRGAPVALPDGAGKEMVQANCSTCHGLNLITGSWGYTRQGWETLFSSMIALPRDQAGAISGYLATHFPVKPAPEAVVIPGAANVSFKEWLAPSLGSRPHDPLAARDGTVWWTGQFAHRLGRVDPRTGAIKEFPLPDGSGPHGLVEDRDGNIWYTGISKNVIGKLNPTTGAVTEHPVQKAEPGSRGPHTPIFDQKGTLWFTLQSGHVGRLIPATGDIRIVPAPSGAGPDLSVRHPDRLAGCAVVRRFPRSQDRQRGPLDDGHQGDRAAGHGRPPAAPGDRR